MAYFGWFGLLKAAPIRLGRSRASKSILCLFLVYFFYIFLSVHLCMRVDENISSTSCACEAQDSFRWIASSVSSSLLACVPGPVCNHASTCSAERSWSSACVPSLTHWNLKLQTFVYMCANLSVHMCTNLCVYARNLSHTHLTAFIFQAHPYSQSRLILWLQKRFFSKLHCLCWWSEKWKKNLPTRNAWWARLSVTFDCSCTKGWEGDGRLCTGEVWFAELRVHTRMYVCMYVCMYECMYAWCIVFILHGVLCTCICMYACYMPRLSMIVSAHICIIYIYIYIYTIYIYIYIHMYMCIIYIYIYMYT
jgi:hypothetical protein